MSTIRESAVKKLKDGTVLDLTMEEKYFLMRQCAKVEHYEKTLEHIQMTTTESLAEHSYRKAYK